MKLKVNCKLDSKVQKSITPLLKLRREISSSTANAPLTNQLDNEISNFLEKALLLSKEIEPTKEKEVSEIKSEAEENNNIEFKKMLADREIKNKRSTEDWYKKWSNDFINHKNQKSQNKTGLKTLLCKGGGFSIIN